MIARRVELAVLGIASLASAAIAAPALSARAAAPPAPTMLVQKADPGAVDVRAAIAGLSSPDPSVRAAAAGKLGGLHFSKMGAVTAEDVAALAQVLQRGDVDARRAAAGTFIQLSHSLRGGELCRAVLGPLAAALKDADADVASSVATTLGHVKDPRAIPPLIEALGDPRQPVAKSAGASVDHLIDEKSAPLLVPALRHEYARKPIAAALAGVWPAPFAALAAALGSQDVELRRGSAFALAQVSDQRTREPLVKALADPDAEVRVWAATGLVRVGDPSAVEPLGRALNDPDVRVRRAAASALRTGGPAAVDKLIASLQDPDSKVRERAGVSLTIIGDSRAVPPLLEIFRRPNAPDYLTFDLGHWKRNKDIILGLMDTMTSNDPAVRRRAAQALTIDNAKVAILGPAGVAPFVSALKSPDVEVRRVAALSLRTLGARGFVGQAETVALAEAARDPDPQVSQWAAATLARLEQLRRAMPAK